MSSQAWSYGGYAGDWCFLERVPLVALSLLEHKEHMPHGLPAARSSAQRIAEGPQRVSPLSAAWQRPLSDEAWLRQVASQRTLDERVAADALPAMASRMLSEMRTSIQAPAVKLQ